MTTTMPYACKFCRKPGTVKADTEGFSMVKPEVWIPNIACNRCAGFKAALWKLDNSVANACQVLNTCRASFQGEKKEAAELKIRKRIDDFTKMICNITCEHYRVTNVWSADFTQMILDKPGHSRIAIGVYVKGIAKESKTQPDDDYRSPHNDE